MDPRLKGCTRSWVGWLEAAIFNCPFRTTASLVQSLPRAAGAILLGLVSGLEIVILCAGCGLWVFGSCRSRVFQGLRVPFSPVTRGNWFSLRSCLFLWSVIAPVMSSAKFLSLFLSC